MADVELRQISLFVVGFKEASPISTAARSFGGIGRWIALMLVGAAVLCWPLMRLKMLGPRYSTSRLEQERGGINSIEVEIRAG